MCDISEYISKDFEQDRAAYTCTREYSNQDRHNRLHSVMKDFEMVSNTAQGTMDRMDKHAATCGSVASVDESRKWINLSQKVGKPGWPPGSSIIKTELTECSNSPHLQRYTYRLRLWPLYWV